MSPWLTAPADVLGESAAAFGVQEVRAPERLAEAARTGFVWTQGQGLVVQAGDARYLRIARGNPGVCVIVVPPALARASQDCTQAVVVAARADELFHHLHRAQRPPVQGSGPRVDAGASVDASAIVSGDVVVSEGACIGPRAVVEGPVRIGRGARIDAGAVVGCDGLFVKSILGSRHQMPHFGGVDIGDGAHVHAGAVVVRSALVEGWTRVGRGAHVGVMANVGHDAEVGEDATVSSNVVVAGRARIGARSWIGASATVSNMVQVGEGAQVRIGAVVIQDVPDGGDVSGNFSLAHARNMKRYLREQRDDA
jgi:UDP-3-O-[3-hydroxymyristoyl] glucosamine N-acyltransferase